MDDSPAPGGHRLDVGALSGIVGFHLARAAVSARTAYERCIGKPFRLKRAEFSLLMIVLANEAVAPKRLARALAITAPKLTLLLDGLQARGLITREPNPNDGRSQHVRLTPPGRTLAREAAAAAEPMEQQMAAPLTRAEHAMLIELLDKLAGHG